MKEQILKICQEADSTVDYTQTNLIDGNLIDSVVLVEITSEIMDLFDIDIPFDEIIPDNFNSIDAMVKLVEKYV